jgi:hypothetical protein
LEIFDCARVYASQDINMWILCTQASNRFVQTIVRYYSWTINKACPRGLSIEIHKAIWISYSLLWERVVRKRAASVCIQVGVHNPERRTGVVDGSHIVCCIADENSSLTIAANQLVWLRAALRWITLPAERRPDISEITTRETRASIPSLSICCKNWKHK